MEIAEKILQGDIASASRLITMIENSSEEAVDALKIIFPRTGNAYVVGITGAPGAGKSTLICEIIVEFRRRNQTVGVIAVDATSPFSGGALLGDRVRMQKHDIYRDEGFLSGAWLPGGIWADWQGLPGMRLVSWMPWEKM